MPRLNPTTFRLTREDLAIMDEAQVRFGLASRTEALRYLLRLWDGSVAVLRAAYAARRPEGRRGHRPGGTAGSEA